MRRLFLAATILGATCSAQAADMPDYFPALRGGYTDGLGTRKVNWDGVYVGGQWQYGSITSKPDATINNDLISTFVPPTGVAYNWKNLGTASGSAQGWGGFAGYNSQWDDVVIGVEANYIHTSLRALTSGTGYTYNPDLSIASVTNSSAAIRPTDFGSLRLRAGYAVDNFLPYLFGGFGFGSTTVDRKISASPAPVLSPDLIDSNTKTTMVYGYSAGAGVDVMLAKGLFLRAEYEYQRVTSTIESNINSGRVGIGYKF